MSATFGIVSPIILCTVMIVKVRPPETKNVTKQKLGNMKSCSNEKRQPLYVIKKILEYTAQEV